MQKVILSFQLEAKRLTAAYEKLNYNPGELIKNVPGILVATDKYDIFLQDTDADTGLAQLLQPDARDYEGRKAYVERLLESKTRGFYTMEDVVKLLNAEHAALLAVEVEGFDPSTPEGEAIACKMLYAGIVAGVTTLREIFESKGIPVADDEMPVIHEITVDEATAISDAKAKNNPMELFMQALKVAAEQHFGSDEQEAVEEEVAPTETVTPSMEIE